MLVIMWTWPRPRPRLWRGSPSFSRRNPLVLVIQVLAPYALGARTHEPSQPGWRRGARESSIFSRDTAPNSQLRSQTFRCPEGIPGKATGIPVLEPTGLEPEKGTEGTEAGHGANTHREPGGTRERYIQVENTLFFTPLWASSEKAGLLLIPPPAESKSNQRPAGTGVGR